LSNLPQRPAGPLRADLFDAQKRAAIPLLLARLKDLKNFAVNEIRNNPDTRIAELESRIQRNSASIFGPNNHEYRQMRMAWSLTPIGISIPTCLGAGTPTHMRMTFKKADGEA
jgi:hypothetical protein